MFKKIHLIGDNDTWRIKILVSSLISYVSTLTIVEFNFTAPTLRNLKFIRLIFGCLRATYQKHLVYNEQKMNILLVVPSMTNGVHLTSWGNTRK